MNIQEFEAPQALKITFKEIRRKQDETYISAP